MSEISRNPLMAASPEIMTMVERLLSDIWRSGEWCEHHETMLAKWREARGEAGLGPWTWWAGDSEEVEDEGYRYEGPDRNSVIAAAFAEFPLSELVVVEARSYADTIKDGEDVSPFAVTRNKMTIPGAHPDGECCATALEGL